MEFRITTPDGRRATLRVDDEAVARGDDRPPIVGRRTRPIVGESDAAGDSSFGSGDTDSFVADDVGFASAPEANDEVLEDPDREGRDDLDEGSTEAIVMVEPRPSNLTVEGAISAIGETARGLAARGGYHHEERNWWHDWGKYVCVVVALLALNVLRTIGVF